MSSKQGGAVAVVTISEQFPYHGNKFDVAVFATMDKATAWVEDQISSIVKELHLPPEAVDDWFITLENVCHTIQYDVQMIDVQ